MVSSVGIGIHDGPPSPRGDGHLHHSSRMEGLPPPSQMEYRHAPPPGYGGPPPMPHGYPYPPPYYGGPTPPPPYGMPPGAYPPFYGHPGYGPPPQPHGAGGYGYGYDPSYGYPSQQPRDVKKSDSSKLPLRKAASGRTSRTSTSPTPQSTDPSPTPQQQPPQWRAPSAASESPTSAADYAPSLVKPIETDFHFFVKEMTAVLRPAAEEEVQKSMAEKGSLVTPSDVLYLINSNLNTRIIKAWEDLTAEKRLEYMTKEENDRRRFMNEDSVASRHCATLTARNKSPRADSNKANKESRDASEQRTGKPSPSAQSTGSSGSDDGADDETSPHRNPSPSRKIHSKTHVKEEKEQKVTPSDGVQNVNAQSLDADEEEKKVDGSDEADNNKVEEDELTGGKRVGSPTTPEEEEGTPTKRNRREGDSGDDLHVEGRETI